MGVLIDHANSWKKPLIEHVSRYMSLLIIGLLVTLLVAACAVEPIIVEESSTIVESADAETVVETATEEMATGAEVPEAEFADLLEIDPNNFDDPTTIDNPWMPLVPGTQLVYDGVTVENGEEIPHRIIFTVTDLTKEINGIKTRVIWDRDFRDGVLEESKLTFFAQDNDGNVWHLGQYREMYEGPEMIGSRVWIVGHLDGARAGIMMHADPQLDDPSYSQGYAPPPFYWTDRARIVGVGQTHSVPYGVFDNTLVTEEYNQEEPSAFQLKYYGHDVGNIGIGWSGDDANQETLDLVDVISLTSETLAEIRAEALKLDERAFLFATTPAAEPATASAERASDSGIVVEAATVPTDAEVPEAEFADMMEIDPSDFDNSTVIDNEWMPLIPGMQLIYEGVTIEEGKDIPHRVIFTVTDLKKEINGIETVVIWERDFRDDVQEEAELAFFAQDNDGNVWHLGQYPEIYDGPELIGGRGWIVGHLADARAGIIMYADPQLGDPSYSQGYAPPPYHWTDRARVVAVGQSHSVPYDDFDSALVTEEFNQEEPDAFQLKYYGRGVGNIGVGWSGDDPNRETLDLVNVITLDSEELADVRAEALKLEERYYIYATTPPAE